MNTSAQVHPGPDDQNWDLSVDVGGCTSRRKSHVGAVLADYCDRQEEASDQPEGAAAMTCRHPESAVSDALRVRCQRIGMAASPAWAEYHEKPGIAMASHFTAQFVLLGVTVYLFTGAPFTRFYYSIPYLVSITIHCGHIALAWLRGPMLSLNPVVSNTYPVYCIGVLIPKFSSYLGPTERIPFGNLVHYTAVCACFFFTRVFLDQAGFLHTFVPPEPFTSLAPWLLKAGTITARVLDSLTDMAFVRVLIDDRNSGCWWWGEPGQCGVFTTLLVVVIVCAAMDIFVTTISVLAGTKLNDNTKLVMGLHTTCMLCELGVISVTLLQLLGGKNPDADASTNKQHLGAALASLATTAVTFSLTVVGAGSVISGVKVLIKRISVAGTRKSGAGKRASGETNFCDKCIIDGGEE